MTERRLDKTGATIDRVLARVREKLVKHHKPGSTAFKDQHRELQELAREVLVLRTHNLQFKEGDPQDQLLMAAEGAMILVCLERFLRAVLGIEATNGDTLHSLLEKVFSEKRYDQLEVPGGDREHLIELVTGLRNGLLHGDFEQLARRAGSSTTREYFKHSYARDLEALYKILNNMMSQIDVSTGSIYEARLRVRWQTRLLDALSRRAAWRAAIDAMRARAKRR
jgi:hypothetical protein